MSGINNPGMLTLLMLVTAYLLGSVSSAVLIARCGGLADPRHLGSGNPGATNMYRIGGKWLAVLTLLADVLKGVLPVWFSYALGIQPLFLGMIAIAACLGHMFPLYFRFAGGKGVATALGALLPIGWSVALLLIVTWVAMLWWRGYSSLAAIITLTLAPFYTWLFKPQYTLPVVMLSVLVLARHHGNIRRLLNGEESKVWDKGRVRE